MKGLLFLIIGPSGVGKNTIINGILESNKNICFVVSYSSRSIRNNESMGNPYYFVSHDEFEKMILNDELLEWKFVHGNYYGIGKKKIQELLKIGGDLITDVEVLGAIDIIDSFPLNCISIYIESTSKDELIKRIKARSFLSEKELKKRLSRISLESQYKYHFDYLIYNTNIKQCINHLIDIIKLEKNLKENSIHFCQKPILHYFLTLIIFNFNKKSFLCKKYFCDSFSKKKWSFISTHILAHESPEKAVYRELQFISLSLELDYYEFFEKENLKFIFGENIKINNHYHYNMIYCLNLSYTNFDIINNHYKFDWFTYDQAMNYLNENDKKICKNFFNSLL